MKHFCGSLEDFSVLPLSLEVMEYIVFKCESKKDFWLNMMLTSTMVGLGWGHIYLMEWTGPVYRQVPYMRKYMVWHLHVAFLGLLYY